MTNDYLIHIKKSIPKHEMFDFIQYLHTIPKDIKQDVSIKLNHDKPHPHMIYKIDMSFSSHIQGIAHIRKLIYILKGDNGLLGNYDTLDNWEFGPDGSIINEI